MTIFTITSIKSWQKLYFALRMLIYICTVHLLLMQLKMIEHPIWLFIFKSFVKSCVNLRTALWISPRLLSFVHVDVAMGWISSPLGGGGTGKNHWELMYNLKFHELNQIYSVSSLVSFYSNFSTAYTVLLLDYRTKFKLFLIIWFNWNIQTLSSFTSTGRTPSQTEISPE